MRRRISLLCACFCLVLGSVFLFAAPAPSFAEEAEAGVGSTPATTGVEVDLAPATADELDDKDSGDGISLLSSSTDVSSVTGVTLGTGFTVYTTQTVDQAVVYEQALTRVRYWRQDALDDTSVTISYDGEVLTMREYLAKIGMSENEYLSPQWSNALERIAVQRAIEAYSYKQGHTRPSATFFYSAKYNGVSSSEEVIAWGGSNITQAIDAWAEEKSDYVNTTGEETGHYTTLIMPGRKYYGFAVCGSVGVGEARSNLSSADNTSSYGLKGTYTFEVAVSDLHVNEGVTWSGQDTVAPGTSETYALKLVYASAARSYFIKGTWSSSNTSIATIDQNGVLIAKNNGTTTITLASEGKSWSKEITVSRIDVSKTTVSLDSSTFTYSGAAQTPGVTVTYGSKTLVENTDYKVSYSNNTNAGTATVTITGLGNYTGTTNAQFTINPFKISYRNSTVTLNPSSYTYTGNPIKPEPVVKYGDTTLVKDKDYTLTYEDNVEAAGYSAAVIVAGAGNYTGYMYKYFTISRALITSDAITLSQTSYTYTGSEITPGITVAVNGKTLKQETDYTVSYVNNASVGTAYVYIYGKGNYRGTAYKAFTITEAGLPATPTTPSTPSTPSSSVSWTRLWGDTRYDTMQRIAEAGWTKSDSVIIAVGSNYADALTASSLAGAKGCPILLTAKNSLSAQVSSEIRRLGAKTAYIVGGHSALSSNIDAQVKALGCTVQRVYGNTRQETAQAISNQVGSAHGDTCIVATGKNYPDALSISAYSYAHKAPIYLTEGNGTLSASTLSTIRAAGFKKVVIVGGNSVVAPSVQNQLSAYGVTSVERLGGATRYETSALIADWSVGKGMSAQYVAVATGKNFADALAGGALCGKNNSVLVLADDGNRTCITGFVASKKGSIVNGYVLGGPSAVSESTWNSLPR